MTEGYQNEVPKARVNIKLDPHTGHAWEKVALPLKLLVMGNCSTGQGHADPLRARENLFCR